MKPVVEWRIHIGAHKTATTHVQDTLFAYRTEMAQHGLDYIPREAFGPLQRRYSNPERWRKKLWSPPLAYMLRKQVNALRTGPETVVLSDEDLLGYSYDLLTPTLYPTIRSAHIIKALTRSVPLKLFLAIRSYDKILPSAYIQILKSHSPTTAWKARVTDEAVKDFPDWRMLIERLQWHFPKAQLYVWQQEHYRNHWQDILTWFVGRNVGDFPNLPPPKRTASPSVEAVRMAEKLEPELPMNERRRQVQQNYANMPVENSSTQYQPYSKEVSAALRNKYEIHLKQIEDTYPEMLFKPKSSTQS